MPDVRRHQTGPGQTTRTGYSNTGEDGANSHRDARPPPLDESHRVALGDAVLVEDILDTESNPSVVRLRVLNERGDPHELDGGAHTIETRHALEQLIRKERSGSVFRIPDVEVRGLASCGIER